MIFTVAIDGPAAAGKGTISRAVAARFGFGHLDTGLLYRAVGAIGGDPVTAARGLQPADLARADLRTLEAGQAASRVAAIPEVRLALVEFQRQFAKAEGGAVLDGRDIGTVICPEADLKLFVTATPEIRARRRWLELGGEAGPTPYDAVLAEVRDRDERDRNRADAPLRAANDAVVLDTSDITEAEAVTRATALIGAAIARRFGPAPVVFHLPMAALETWRKAPFLALYPRIADVLAAHGVSPRVEARGDTRFPGPRPGDGALHLVEAGQVQGPGWLNCALAYLIGFWHLDPEGTLAGSSARHARFDPASVDAAAAQSFADELRARFVTPRLSRYRQDPTPATGLPQGAIVVFFQGPVPHTRGEAYLTDDEMLRATIAAAEGRPVLVKAHPLKPEPGRRAIAAALEDGLQLTPTEANVHDLLSAAAVTVSINSAAAIEGMLHGKPAILCGRADFAQLAETVTSPEEMAPALSRALRQPRDHDRGLFWYFSQHCLDIVSPGFEARLFDWLAAEGFPPERLGIST